MSGTPKDAGATGSNEIQQRPAHEPTSGGGERDPHREAVPDEDAVAKGGPPGDDRLGTETAHARQPAPAADTGGNDRSG